MKRTAISVIDMGLRFPKGTLSINTLRTQLISFFSRKKENADFIALDDVNLEITEGEVVGIIAAMQEKAPFFASLQASTLPIEGR